MKIVVMGGTGLIGSKTIPLLRAQGHEAVAASPDSGVNTITAAGLGEALEGAAVIVDVTNSPSFEEKPAMDFFTTSTRNLLRYGATAGVQHHVVLSVVGTERLSSVGYFRAKQAQEDLLRTSGAAYSIVHATQFFEFIKRIADDATVGGVVRLPSILIQPMAADDVASAVARVAVGTPLYGVVEVAGPERFRIDELVRQGLRARGDRREVITDPQAPYYGAVLEERVLIPRDDARLGEVRLGEWLGQPAPAR